jgi:hypothetical protein
VVQLQRIYFLVHASIYEAGRGEPEFEAKYPEYIRHEAKVKRRWMRTVLKMQNEEFLAAFSPASDELAGDMESILGPRMLTVRDNIIAQPELWDDLLDEDARQGLGRDIMSMFWRDGYCWSSEALVQPVIARGWAQRLREVLQRRGFTYDPRSVVCEGWGESFEGCVANYCRHLGTYLGLHRPIKLNFPMTVPDAPFLLDARARGAIPLDEDVLLYLWQRSDGLSIGWYHRGLASIGEAPLLADIDVGSMEIEVRGKRTLYWPARDSGVKWREGRLIVPIEGDNFVICKGGTWSEFRKALAEARIRQRS